MLYKDMLTERILQDASALSDSEPLARRSTKGLLREMQIPSAWYVPTSEIYPHAS